MRQVPKSVDKEVGREIRREIIRKSPIDEVKTELISEFYLELGFDRKTKVYVVKEREFNAFALPDNSIFVFDQVLKEVESYPELAGLLAHEYMHIKERHGMKNLVHSLSRQLISEILTGKDKSNTIISNSSTLLELENSREFETDADFGGLDLLEEKNIDLNGLLIFFKRMEKFEYTKKQIPSYLSTHPDVEDRIEYIEEEINNRKNNYKHNQKLENLFIELTTFENRY